MSQPRQTVSSDLLTVLQNIDVLVCQMRRSLNGVSERLLAMTVAVECITLTMKLRATLQRWQVYLPFHECRDVDFAFWIKYLTGIRKSLNTRQRRLVGISEQAYYPSHAFCLDLLENGDFEAETGGGSSQSDKPLFALCHDETDLQKDVMEYVLRKDELINRLSALSETADRRWQTCVSKRAMSMLRNQYAGHLHMVLRNNMSRYQVETEVLPKVRANLNAVVDQTGMDYCLDMALDNLTDIMRQIDNLFSSDKSRQQFLRLSLRLYYRHCPDDLAEASRRVHRWSSEWPDRKRKQWAVEKRDQLVATLRQRHHEQRITDYIDIERPAPLTDFEFGHFLFACRHELEIASVKSLFQDCLLIQQLNRLIDPASAEADTSAARLVDHRRVIYQRLCTLVSQAEWQGGMTAERVRHCFDRLLLKPPSAADGQADIGETFWKLLTHRRNCEDGLRSLKITWLNLVGYFRSRNFLRGGSPALCRHFFPDGTLEGKGNNADYNAVSKGARNDVGNDFYDLVLVLDKQL